MALSRSSLNQSAINLCASASSFSLSGRFHFREFLFGGGKLAVQTFRAFQLAVNLIDSLFNIAFAFLARCKRLAFV